jgi:hypothetical protein
MLPPFYVGVGVCLGIDERLKRLHALYALEPMAPNVHLLTMLRIKLMLQQVIRDTFKPIGICSTSEKQGGQHEVGIVRNETSASCRQFLRDVDSRRSEQGPGEPLEGR